MVINIDSVRDGKIKFDTLTHLGSNSKTNKKPLNFLASSKPTLCWFSEKFNLYVALKEVVIDTRVKLEISFIDKKYISDLHNFISIDIDENEKANIDMLDVKSLDELISLRWLKLPISKIGPVNYFNGDSIGKHELASVPREDFVKVLKYKKKKPIAMTEQDESTEITEETEESNEVVESSAEITVNEITTTVVKDKIEPGENKYIQALKILSENDLITMPLDVYKTLRVVTRENLFMGRELKQRKELATIKFNDLDNIFAIVETDEDTQLAKIQVLKSYDDIQVTNREVEVVRVKYKQWSRRNSFTISGR